MGSWWFVADLHGSTERYRKLFEGIAAERPRVVLLGGDLLPHAFDRSWAEDGAGNFVTDVLGEGFQDLADALGSDYPRVLLILGNDDPATEEAPILHGATRGLWTYIHDRRVVVDGVPVYGYAFVPPSPFGLKDWERYDVSRYVDPGCTSPEEGQRSRPVREREVRYATIQQDLEQLAGEDDLARAVFLFHTPPYKTKLDRAAIDGRMVDHVPMDVHVGSIAVERFIRARQPRVTLHGHIHESARLTGAWHDRIEATHLFSAAHDGPELALVRFDPERPEEAERDLR